MQKQNPREKEVCLLKIGGVKAVISSKGIVGTNKKISKTIREQINETIKGSLDNILDGWTVEGEYKDGAFYVTYIKNDEGKFFNAEETMQWAKIMELSCSPVCQNTTKNFSGYIRPEKEFYENQRKNVIKEFTNGKRIMPKWKEKLYE